MKERSLLVCTFASLLTMVGLSIAQRGLPNPSVAAHSNHPGNGAYLLVADYDNHQVLRYDEHTGAFIDIFVPKHSAGLTEPQGLVFWAPRS